MSETEAELARELFDPDFLGRLRALFFKLRKRRRLQRKGLQQTISSGFSREFKDHRPYAVGEDFRAIDWRLYARLEKLFVRVFEEVQEFHVHILLDRSLSMASPYPAKRLLALRLSVALAYLALVSQHTVSIHSLAGDLKRETPPRKGQGHIHEILRQMAALPFAGTTNLSQSLARFRPGRARRGIVFLISDLLGGSSPNAGELAELAARWPAETHVIHVLDPLERCPVAEGELLMEDVETGERRRIWLTKRELDAYAASFQSFIDELDQSCSARQINYALWNTGQPFEEMFLDLLSRGSALAGG